MKTAALLVTLVVLGLAAYANAECANACSGHGTCGTKDQCTCYPNWQAADCSERTCPFGLSFVDTPQGDLNHDGSVADSTGGQAVQWANKNTWEKYPNVDDLVDTTDYYQAQADEAHFYIECSNKGHCNRETGECGCFDGYAGSSCQRTKCPSDCSGHGVCRTVQEIAVDGMTNRVESRLNGGDVVRSGVDSSFTYTLWDKDKNQACVCDAGYSGFDCSLRQCPRGDDPMTHRARDCYSTSCKTETQVITVSCSDATCESTLMLTFSEWVNMDWETVPFAINSYTHTTGAPASDAAAGTAVADALMALPNGAVEAVTAVATVGTTATDWDITVTFTANSGNQPLLACTLVNTGGTAATCSVAASSEGNTEEVTCSNRGLCDYETGICKCFKGFYDDDCSVQHALAL